MRQDFFKFLPSEIIMEILSRLPVQAVAASKCVCKPWLHLLETDEFAKSHLAKSPNPVFALMQFGEDLPGEDSPLSCTIFEIENGLDIDHPYCYYLPITKFAFPHDAWIQGFANGLLLLQKRSALTYPDEALNICVCNPITREYLTFDDYPEGVKSSKLEDYAFGFGVSKISGQYKVVMICNDHVKTIYESYVYTLGTKTWRYIGPSGVPTNCTIHFCGAFVNDKLHWLVSDSESSAWICCFDLEAESFTAFSTPPLGDTERIAIVSVFSLEDDLCVCDNTYDEKIVIWLMKECDGRKYWVNQHVVYKDPEVFDGLYAHISSLNVYRDGDILMICDSYTLFFYSIKERTLRKTRFFGFKNTSLLFTPSFVSIKSFGLENVQSL